MSAQDEPKLSESDWETARQLLASWLAPPHEDAHDRARARVRSVASALAAARNRQLLFEVRQYLEEERELLIDCHTKPQGTIEERRKAAELEADAHAMDLIERLEGLIARINVAVSA